MTLDTTSNAAECMSILTNSMRSDKNRNETAAAAGEDFSVLFKRILNAGGHIRETPTGDLLGTVKRELHVPETTFTEYARTPYGEGVYWREESGYDSFLESFQNSKAEYSSDMWDIDSAGEKALNEKGREHFQKWRMERIRQMTPDSVMDAARRFSAGWQHLNNYMHTMFEDNGIEFDFVYEHTAPPESGDTWIQYLYNKIGMPDCEGNAKRLNDFLNGKSGQDMEAMMEEVQFYGAIAELASVNPAFRNAYDKDSGSALAEYAGDISATMNAVVLPKIQTAPNLYQQLLQTGF